MKTRWMGAVAVIGMLVAGQGVRADGDSRLGIGVNYWRVLNNVGDNNIDKHGMSWLLTYQHRLASLLRVEADLEVFKDDFMGVEETVFAPQAYLVVGMGLYGAFGVGILFADGDFADDVFYTLRGGFDLELFPQWYLDLNLNYRFAEGPSLKEVAHDIDGDTLTLGVAVRREF